MKNNHEENIEKLVIPLIPKLFEQEFKKYEKSPESFSINIFDIMNIDYDENTYSDIISWFLNPTNGVFGDYFLRLFLKKLDSLAGTNNFVKISEASIPKREAYNNSTDKPRRIDIQFKINKFNIGVENKTKTLLNEKQVKEELETLNLQYFVALIPDYQKDIFLKIKKGLPLKTIENTKVVCFTYSDIKSLNRAFIEFIRKKHDTNSLFLNHFLKQMNKNLGDHMTGKPFKGFSKDVREYAKRFTFWEFLEQHNPEAYKKVAWLREEFQESRAGLFQEIKANFLDYEHSNPKKMETTYFQFYKESWSKNDIFIHFELFLDESLLAKNVVQVRLDVESKKKGVYIPLLEKELGSHLEERGYFKGKTGCPFYSKYLEYPADTKKIVERIVSELKFLMSFEREITKTIDATR